MKIRRANQNDATSLAKLIREIISTTPHYSEKAQREEARKHNSSALTQYLSDRKYYVCFVAEEDGKIIGFIIGRNEAGVFWADWLGVNKNIRRKGVGESLMMKLESSLYKKGVHKIWCDTRTTNKEALNLLSKLDYKKLSVFKNGWYKQDFFLWEKDV